MCNENVHLEYLRCVFKIYHNNPDEIGKRKYIGLICDENKKGKKIIALGYSW